jgi:hypothetical protein
MKEEKDKDERPPWSRKSTYKLRRIRTEIDDCIVRFPRNSRKQNVCKSMGAIRAKNQSEFLSPVANGLRTFLSLYFVLLSDCEFLSTREPYTLLYRPTRVWCLKKSFCRSRASRTPTNVCLSFLGVLHVTNDEKCSFLEK